MGWIILALITLVLLTALALVLEEYLDEKGE